MANLLKRPNGIFAVRVTIDGKRPMISLGTRSEDRARRANACIHDLVVARTVGEPPEPETKRWVSKVSPKLRKRLEDVGLIEPSDTPVNTRPTLGPFLKDYIKRYGPAKKPATVVTWGQCERLLLEFFPADKPLDQINAGDAEDFRNYLLTRTGDKGGTRKAKPLAEATVRRRCCCAKGFFEYGVSKGLIARNPFDSKRIPTVTPRTKQKHFISPEDADKVMDQLPNAGWRLLFALARWGGMRVPSEPEHLTWDDIDQAAGRINFRTPKTEHHDGKDRREIPIFPELVEPLREAFELAERGEPLVLPWLRKITGTALRKPIIRAIKAAHLTPWPKLWNAMRASRVTELREEFPSHVVDTWIGHDDLIARKHYTQTLDEHFAKGSQFSVRKNPHSVAHEKRDARKPAENRKASHRVASKWAILDSNQ